MAKKAKTAAKTVTKSKVVAEKNVEASKTKTAKAKAEPKAAAAKAGDDLDIQNQSWVKARAAAPAPKKTPAKPQAKPVATPKKKEAPKPQPKPTAPAPTPKAPAADPAATKGLPPVIAKAVNARDSLLAKLKGSMASAPAPQAKASNVVAMPAAVRFAPGTPLQARDIKVGMRIRIRDKNGKVNGPVYNVHAKDPNEPLGDDPRYVAYTDEYLAHIDDVVAA